MKTNFLLILLICSFLGVGKIYSQERDTLGAEDILQMSLSDLMNVKVVTASKTSESIKDVAANITVITKEQIKDRGYLTLEEALSDLPGIQFRNMNGFNSYIFMRGAPSQNNLILLMVDGVQINELNSGGFYGGGQFIMSDIEQIEVMYGPASALYGTNAVSGIVNIITKDAGSESGNISLLGGNFRTGSVSARVSALNSKKDIGFSLSGQYKTSQKADLKGAAGDFNWSDDMENFENDISFSTKLKIKNFSSGITIQEKRTSNTTSFKTTNDISLDRNTLWDIMFLNAYAKYSLNTSDKWSNSTTLYYRNSTVLPNTIYQITKATALSDGAQTRYYRPNDQTGLENQFNIQPLDWIKITAGIIGETENLSNGFSVTVSNSQDSKPVKPASPVMLKNYLFSYYSQAGLSFLNYFSLYAGVRHDILSYYGNVFVPRLGLIFNYDELTAKVMYNKAFRAPKPWDYNFGSGNPDLQPEEMTSLELFVSVKPIENLQLSGSVFNNTIKDKLTREIIIPATDRWINKNLLKTSGFELATEVTFGKVALYGNYSFNDSRDQDEIFISEISKHTGNAGLVISALKDVSFNIRSNYLGDRTNPFIIPSTGNDRIEDVILLNSSVSYNGLAKVFMQLKCNNLLNTEYYHPNNRFQGRYRQPQRSVILALQYNFDFM